MNFALFGANNDVNRVLGESTVINQLPADNATDSAGSQTTVTTNTASDTDKTTVDSLQVTQ